MATRDGKTINPRTNTKFDAGFPARWLEHAAQGGSVPEFCRIERIAPQTFYSYCDKYPAMMAARIMGKAWAEGWWMSQARENLVTYSSKIGSTNFNTSLYKWYMAGRFGHTEDRRQQEMLEELMKRTAHLANAPANAIAEEAECEPDDNTPE